MAVCASANGEKAQQMKNNNILSRIIRSIRLYFNFVDKDTDLA